MQRTLTYSGSIPGYVTAIKIAASVILCKLMIFVCDKNANLTVKYQIDIRIVVKLFLRYRSLQK